MTDLPLPAPFLADTARGLSIVLETIRSGGFIMLVIVACSMAAITIAVMTWLRLREHLLMPPEVISQLRALPSFAEKGDITPLHRFLEADGSMLARLGMFCVSGHHGSHAESQQLVAQKAKEELHRLERDIPFLEVMVTVAPLLGLLGTTAGLVGMFTAFGEGGAGGPDTAAVAREIGVALRCTIAGLFVAVPSVVAHTIFVRKLDGIAVKLESLLTDTLNTFHQHFEIARPGKA